MRKAIINQLSWLLIPSLAVATGLAFVSFGSFNLNDFQGQIASPEVAGATAAQKGSLAGFKQFSTKDGFSFQYPKSFKVQKEELPVEVVLNLIDSRQAQIIVSSSVLANQTFKEMVSKNIESEVSQGQTEFVKQSISDKEAVIENRVKLGPETYYSLSKLVPVGGSKVYSVVFLTPVEIFNDYRLTAEEVINSISD